MLLLGPPRLQTSPQKTIEMEKRSFKKQTARRIVRGVVTLAPAVKLFKLYIVVLFPRFCGFLPCFTTTWFIAGREGLQR